MARVAFASLSFFVPSAPADPFTSHRGDVKTVRQNEKIRGMAKRRCFATLFNHKCALCLLPLCFNLDAGEAARGEVGHTVSIRAWGSSTSPLNLHATHRACNVAAQRAGSVGDDLRPWVAPVVKAWKSATDTLRWEQSPNRYRMGQNLPSEQDMAAARAARGIPF